MQDQLLHLGQIFQRTREERHLSLREVENATSIRVNYLEAIEQGQLGRLISPIYAQGFIKKYATFLELDGDSLLQQHPYVMQVLSESTHRADLALGLSSLEVRGTPAGEVKWLPNLLWVLLSVGGILAGWFLARYLGLF